MDFTDATWFAVDKDGYLACMSSDSNGAVPVEFDEDQLEYLEEIAAATKRELKEDKDGIQQPASIGVYSYSCWGDAFPGMDRLNKSDREKSGAMVEQNVVFAYGRTEFFIEGWKAPEEPLLYAKLSKELKEKLHPVKFSKLSFAGSDWIQPANLTKCWFYKLDRKNPQAVDIDGGVVSIAPDKIDARNLAPPSSGKTWWQKVLEYKWGW